MNVADNQVHTAHTACNNLDPRGQAPHQQTAQAKATQEGRRGDRADSERGVRQGAWAKGYLLFVSQWDARQHVRAGLKVHLHFGARRSPCAHLYSQSG